MGPHKKLSKINKVYKTTQSYKIHNSFKKIVKISKNT